MGKIPVGRQRLQKNISDMFRHKLLILTDRRYIVIVVAETAYTDIFRNFQRHGIAGLDQAVSHPVIFTYDGRDAGKIPRKNPLLLE